MAKTSVNDRLILTLKKQIQDKKDALKSTEKFAPVTNCSLEIFGARWNLNVLGKQELLALLVNLNCDKMSAENLGVLNEYTLSGFKVTEWITDIKARLMIVDRKAEEARLKNMEDKLYNLLSNEKKVELELSEIAKEI
jgi:hypothetical protein